MSMSDILQMGANMFIQSKLSGDNGSGLDLGDLTSAMSGLLGGSSDAEGEGGFDLGSLVSNMASGDLASVAQSWLGDGENEAVSPDQITNIFGADKVSEFANKLGVTEDEALGGLSEAIPQMVDQSSSGGSILDAVGGVSGAIGMAGKLFGR